MRSFSKARLARDLLARLKLCVVAVLLGGCAGSSEAETSVALTQALTQTPASFPATNVIVDVTFPPLSAADRSNLMLGARNTLRVDDRGRIAGAIASAGSATVGNDATVGDVTSTGNVTIGDRSHAGTVASGGAVTLGSSASATGIQQHASLPARSVIRAAVAVPAATTSISLAPNESASLAAGSFGQLILNAGSNLTLSPGTYFVRSLDVEPQSRLIVAGPVTVYVVGSLVFRGIVSDSGDVTRLRVVYTGTSPLQLGAPTRGLWVAPNASVVAIPGSYTGFLYGSSLEISPGASATPVNEPLALLAPALIASGIGVTATQGLPFTGEVARIIDANSSDTAGSFTATIAWGDGTTSLGSIASTAGVFSVTGAHTYATTGTFMIGISITNVVDGAIASATATALVTAPLGLAGIPFAATSGVVFTGIVASLTDPNPNDVASDFAAKIDWGDGTQPGAGFVLASGTQSTPFEIGGTHAYATFGTFQVKVTVANPGTGAVAITTTTATVIAQLVVTGSAFTAAQGVLFSGVFANLTDANAGDVASNFAATVDWGDGTSDSTSTSNVRLFATASPGTFAVDGDHTYANAGAFTVRVSVSDAVNRATATATTTATVSPQLILTPAPFAASPNVPFGGVVANLTDANTSDTTGSLIATIDWGDGTTDSLSSGVFIIAAGSPGAFAVGGQHTYSTSGSVTVTVSVSSTAGGATTRTGFGVDVM